MVAFTSLYHFVQHDPESAASPGCLSTGTSTTLSMYCSWCASAVFWNVCGVGTCFCIAMSSSLSGVQAPPRSQRNGCSRSSLCRASVGPRQSSSASSSSSWLLLSATLIRSSVSSRYWRLGGASCPGLSRPVRWNTRSCSQLSRHRAVDLDCSRRCNVGLSLSSAHRHADTGLFSPAVSPRFSVLLHSGARQSCWDLSFFSSSVSCGALRRLCSSIGRCLLIRRNHNDIHMFSLGACWRDKLPQELVFVLLRHSKCLISQLMYQLDHDPRHRHHCCHQAFFHPSRNLIDHIRMAASCLLFFASDRRASTPSNLDNACSSSQNFLLMASSSLSRLALLINSRPPSRASSP